MSVDKFMLDKNNAALLIIDIQERLAVVMDRKDQVVKNTLHLVELARMQNFPIVVTEQYPKGLGRTVPEIQSSLPLYLPIEKISFNCCGEAAFNEQIKRLGRKKIIVTGMETHICVLQTASGSSRRASMSTSWWTRCAQGPRRTGGRVLSSSATQAVF